MQITTPCRNKPQKVCLSRTSYSLTLRRFACAYGYANLKTTEEKKNKRKHMQALSKTHVKTKSANKYFIVKDTCPDGLLALQGDHSEGIISDGRVGRK
jgi:hypothetical protein